jgi:hypothetical protein
MIKCRMPSLVLISRILPSSRAIALGQIGRSQLCSSWACELVWFASDGRQR